MIYTFEMQLETMFPEFKNANVQIKDFTPLLYFLIFLMDILGNIYYVNEDNLEWFELFRNATDGVRHSQICEFVNA